MGAGTGAGDRVAEDDSAAEWSIVADVVADTKVRVNRLSDSVGALEHQIETLAALVGELDRVLSCDRLPKSARRV